MFATVTPSERHYGLAIRLFRGRRSDPAYACAEKEFLPFLDHNIPSLCPPEVTPETVTFGLPVDADLPDYDLRRLITARDPLCCVNAFLVACKVELPSLYEFRMCPKCPHCATSKEPCMDIFGSSATPMGGGAGRCENLIKFTRVSIQSVNIRFFAKVSVVLGRGSSVSTKRYASTTEARRHPCIFPLLKQVGVMRR